MFDYGARVRGFNEDMERVNAYIDEVMNINTESGPLRRVLGPAVRSRGKMIRSSLLLLSGRFGAGCEAARARLCKLGALVEIIHLASLIHDDIVDDAPFRRGRPTAQAAFGKDMAVYAGDFLLCRVMIHIFKEEMGDAGVALARTIEDMCRGEIGQMACRWDTETGVDTYLNNIYGKTAALFATVCRLGAAEGGCGEGATEKLSRVGEHLGFIFQMRDDLLDFLSDEEREGKPLHKDFADGIYTFPVLFALKSNDYGERLREIAAENAAGERFTELMDEMRRLVVYSGGIEYTWNQIESHAQQVERIIGEFPGSAAADAMSELICWLKDRRGLSACALRLVPADVTYLAYGS